MCVKSEMESHLMFNSYQANHLRNYYSETFLKYILYTIYSLIIIFSNKFQFLCLEVRFAIIPKIHRLPGWHNGLEC